MMQRSMLPLAIAALSLGLVLSGCTGLTPVYGSRAAMEHVSFNFAPPQSRTGQIIINKLKSYFPAPATPASPTLTVTARLAGSGGPQSKSIAINRQYLIRVEATVTVTQDDTVLFTTKRFADSAYASGALYTTEYLSRNGAEEGAAASIAESLRAAILAVYRPSRPRLTPH